MRKDLEDANIRKPRNSDFSSTPNSWDPTWHPFRIKLAKFIGAKAFEVTLSFVIIANVALLVHETDIAAQKGSKVPPWLSITNQILLGIYTVELAARLYTFRISFWNCRANQLDFWVVVSDIACQILDASIGDMPVSLSFLRILRVLRAVRFIRAVRTLELFRELYMMMHSFASAMRAILWATVLLFLMLIFWSIIAVQVIHPLNIELAKSGIYNDVCERCPRAFASVWASTITFIQQIVAGDSWGAVTIPIMERHPETALFFLSVLVSTALGLLNLIVMVIVDKAAQVHDEDKQKELTQKMLHFEDTKQELKGLCQEIDADSSGQLSKNEFLDGYRHLPQFAHLLNRMHIEGGDLDNLFTILDADGSGLVDYNEFVDELVKMKYEDNHMLLIYIQSYVKDVRSKVSEELAFIRAKAEQQEANFALLFAKLDQFGDDDPSMFVPQEPCSTIPCVKSTSIAKALPTLGVDACLLQKATSCELLPSEDTAWAELEERLQELQMRVSGGLFQVLNDIDASLVGLRNGARRCVRRGTDQLAGLPPQSSTAFQIPAATPLPAQGAAPLPRGANQGAVGLQVLAATPLPTQDTAQFGPDGTYVDVNGIQLWFV